MPRSNGETANREPAHDLQEILEHITSHVDVRVSAPMSSSVLGLHSAPRAHSGPAAGGSFGGGPRPAAPAGHPRPAAPVGYCGRRCVAGDCGLEPAMRSRRWRSDAVGLPGPAHGCPELVKPILHTDIGVGMSSHPSGRASRVDLHGRGASSPSPPTDPIGPARRRAWSISWRSVLRSGGAEHSRAWESNDLGDVPLVLGFDGGPCGRYDRIPTQAVGGLQEAPAGSRFTHGSRSLDGSRLDEALVAV